MQIARLLLVFVAILVMLLAVVSSSAAAGLPPCRESYNAATWTNCVGEATSRDGNKYVGEWKDGKRNGQGTDTWPDGQKYVGEFKDGKRNGQGTYTWSGGEKYAGEWKDGTRDGQGTEYRADGTILRSGIWENGVFGNGRSEQAEATPSIKPGRPPSCREPYNAATWTNCIGEVTSRDGNKYVGEWKDGKRNGQGTDTWPDGRKYVGEFKDGNYNGQGTYTSPDGQKYVGEWKDGKRSGQGTEYRADGTILRSGIWESGVFGSGRSEQAEATPSIKPGRLPPCREPYNAATWTNCIGEATSRDGNKYVGEWKDGKRNGQGTYTWPDGQQYVGEFKDGNYNGQGTYTWPGGRKYVGEWQDGRPSGQGTRRNAR